MKALRGFSVVLSPFQQAKTMSSWEIAELTGKTQKNVLRDIRSMVSALGRAVSGGPKLDSIKWHWHCQPDKYQDMVIL